MVMKAAARSLFAAWMLAQVVLVEVQSMVWGKGVLLISWDEVDAGMGAGGGEVWGWLVLLAVEWRCG